MYEYPYDEMRGGNSEELLKACYGLSHELMAAYEPFGQANSTYEDTGYPEMTAIGIRTFLSVPANIRMMKDIGKATLESIETLGKVVEADKIYKTTHQDKKNIGHWKLAITDIKLTCEKTYNAIMSSVREYIKRNKEE